MIFKSVDISAVFMIFMSNSRMSTNLYRKTRFDFVYMAMSVVRVYLFAGHIIALNITIMIDVLILRGLKIVALFAIFFLTSPYMRIT